MKDNGIYYHRPQSTRFHIKRCVLLEGDGIKKYHTVDNETIKEEHLLPCPICLSGKSSQVKAVHE